MPQEVKQFGLTELKFAAGAEGMLFEGYGAYFNNIDSYGDAIAPGAFARTLREAKRNGVWPAMLEQHGSWLGGADQTPIGIWTSLKEDEKGLRVEGKLADTQRGRDLYALLKMEPRPAIDGLSIGFFTKKYTAGTKPTEPKRLLEDVELLEVSLVTFPANGKARVTGVKSLNARALEAILRSELNLSQADAVKAVALVKEALRDGGNYEIGDDRDGADLKELADLVSRNIEALRV